MTLKDDYQRIAHRSLNASESLLQAGIQEKATFMTYHAFESTGCALSESCGLTVGPKVHHTTKLEKFKQATQRVGHYHRRVASLAFRLGNLRNSMLYPNLDRQNNTIKRPENAITLKDARELKGHVEGIVNWVDQKI